MKRIFTFLLALIVGAGTLFAASGTCGANLTWELNSKGVLTISGSGDMTDWVIENAPWYSSRSSIKTVKIEYGVTSIGRYAFYNCNNISSVTIGSSVKSIKNYAFKNCYNLLSVIIPNSVTSIGNEAFHTCSSLASVSIGESVTSFGTNVFQDCNNLEYITWNAINCPDMSPSPFYLLNENIRSFTFGGNVQKIPGYICYGMNKLTSITIHSNVTSIGGGAFNNCTGLTTIVWNAKNCSASPFSSAAENITSFTFGNEVESIPSDICKSMNRLTEITIPNSVKSIGGAAFYKCTGLSSITIPNSVTSIGDIAFSDCTGLTAITIPNSVTSIGKQAFFNCSGLTSVTIGESVTSMGADVFYNCSGLKTIVWNAKNCSSVNPFASAASSITSFTFGSAVESIPSNICQNMNRLTEITIPNSVKSIGGSAFYGCTGLTDVTIGTGVTSFGNQAFYNCTGLKTIVWNAKNCSATEPFNSAKGTITSFTFGNEVESIPDNLCIQMSKLTTITIPNSVTSIGDLVFTSCSGLKSVTIGSSVTSIEHQAFYGCSGLTSITSLAVTPPTCGTECFFGVDKTIPVYVPVGSVASYKKKGEWADFYNIIIASGTCGDNLTWVLDGDGVLTIKGTGKMTGWVQGKNVPWYDYRASIKSVVIEAGVTSIGSLAFNGYSSITSVTIPAGITNIGSYAFYGCTGLKSITIPDGVTTLEEGAFQACTGFTTITLPASVNTLGENALSGCSSLQSITCEATTPPHCDDECFVGVTKSIPVYVPVQSVDAYKSADVWKDFSNILPLVEYPIVGTCGKEGDNLTWTLDEDGLLTISGTGEMADWTFNNPSPWNPYASLIETVVIEDCVTSIGDYAFSGCSNLTSITIPNSVTSIGNWAFDGCSGLTSVTIGNSVTRIGSSAFSGCSNLTSVTIGNSVTSIGDGAFWSCSNLTSIEIPNNVTSIGDAAFYDCSSLTTVTIPNSVTSIGDGAFYDCSSLTTVIIPNSVTSIGNWAFEGCTGLTSVTIGNNVTSIGEWAFSYCTGLTSITCEAITPPACGEDCFLNVDKSIPVYVPVQSVEAYKSADVWKDFENIQALPVHTCADANTALDGTTVQIAFADVIFVSGRYAYIQDETGTTLLYLNHADDNIQPGLRIMDLQGEVDIYHGLPEIRPSNQDDWTLAVPEEIIPKVVSLEDVPTAGMVNQLVFISKASVEAGEFTTSSQSNLAIQMPNGGSAILRNQFRQEETFAENKVYDVMAAVAVYNTTVQLYFIQVLGAYDLYHVRFLSDDGATVLDDQIVPAGTVPVFGGEIPVKEDQGCYTYPFAGWDKTIYPASQDIDYKAVYEEEVKDYTVTFLSDDGETILGEFTVACGTDLSDPEIIAEIESYLDLTKKSTAQYNYTFAGWTPALDVLTGDATYTAVYEEELRYYTITWIDWDGSFIDEETYPYGDMPSHFGPARSSTPQYDYTFSGWSPAIAPVSGDATYTAFYKETLRSYTVTWKMDDGSVIAQEDYTYGDMPNHAAPVKESTAQFHYTFAGWSPNVVKVTGPAIYTAVFDAELRSYTVTWVNWDGTVLDKETYNYGSTPYYVYDDPTRPATAENTFTFTGWSPEISEVTGDVTYKAQFSATGQTYTITWKMDDGSVIAKETYAYGDMPNHAAPVKESTAQYNYTFTGWTPEISKVTGDATYTAVFKAEVRSYTVTWLNWDGAELAKETYAYGAQPEYKGNTPARKATAQFSYTFTGWNPAVAKVTGDATYTATFKETKNSYTITWKMDDGSVIAKETYAYGDMPSHAAPVKEATAQYTYTFTGWTPAVVAVTSDATYTAVFSATERSYTVTWLNWDGKQLAKQSYAYGLTPSYNGAVPVRPATEQFSYTFTGWTPAVVPVSGDATYTAVFKETKNSYTITWKMDDGSVIAQENYNYGDMPNHAAPVKEATAQYTYTFTGWSPALTSVSGDATYTAVFSATERSYTVTWLNWDGSQLAKESYKYGATPSFKGSTPVRPATAQNTFTFTGWSPAIALVSGDVTYKAQFSATGQTYTITWKMDDGSVIAKETYAYGDMPNHTAPVKEATTQYTYTFEGWTPAVVAVTSDATYTAVFKAEVRNYTVSWLNWDGSELAKESYAYGTQPAYKGATPSRPATEQFSYTFTGWTPAVAKVTGDATYTAVFKETKNSYTITWKMDDGSVIAKETYAYGDMPSHAVPVKEATAQYTYTFTGWNPAIVPVTEDATYTAVFKATVRSYKVTFLDKDGKVIEVQEVLYNEAAVAPQAPEVEGYVFIGWDTPFDAVKSDLTVKALYEEVKDYTPSNLNALLVPKADDVQITLSWDKVEGAVSYELRVLADDVELFSQNTMTQNIISSPLSDIVNTYKINPGTYTMTWFVRSTDALGHAISDWAEGPQFEVTVNGQGFETTKDEVQSVKIYRNGRFYILRGDAIYTIQGQKVN